MADTFTSNLLLILPDLGDTFDFNAHVIANFTTLDTLFGAVQCTSTTRPTNTFAGQIVYETDSKRYVQNTGTKAVPAWTYMSHAALAVTAATNPTSGRSTGGLIYETDSTYLKVWNGSAWEQKAYSNLVTTSSAHPASPFQGLEIYETDTGLNGMYNGSAYRYNVAQASATTVLGGTTASVTFSGLPAISGFLVRWAARATDAVASEALWLRFNGDTGANYASQKVVGNNASASSVATSGAAQIEIGTLVGANGTANYWASGSFEVSPGGTGQYTTAAGTGAAFVTTTNSFAGSYGGQWLSTATPTSMTVQGASGSLAARSSFSVYVLP